MASLEILNPVAQIKRTKIPAASRLDSLEGKTVGLFWNIKSGGDIALAAISEELARRYSGMSFRSYIGSRGAAARQATGEELDSMAAECDAVVGTTAD